MRHLQHRNHPSRDPFHELNWMLQRALGPMADNDTSDIATSQWMPRVDIKEDPDRFLIQADIPGVDPKDIEIHMEKGVLTIKGERDSETKEEGDTYSRTERQRGSFHRRFALPESADQDAIAATGKHGVLEISIPKRPAETPRRIEVS